MKSCNTQSDVEEFVKAYSEFAGEDIALNNIGWLAEKNFDKNMVSYKLFEKYW